MRRLLITTLLITCFSITACSSWLSSSGKGDIYKGYSAKQLFDYAESALAKSNYSDAIKRFEALDANYPFSKYAEQAQIDMVYAYYKNEDYASAAASADRYIHLYPRSQHTDYAYYIKGMSNFRQKRGAFATFLPLDESWRDPGTQKQAYDDFATLLKRFPKSAYVADARQRMVYLRNQLAKKEINIANFYMKRKMYVAASNRASYVIKNFSQADQTEAALELLYRANKALGLNDAAKDARTVLKASYPHSAYLS